MESTMKKEELQAKLDQLEAERQIRDRQATTHRARSICVGTAFGGTTEITMRADDGSTVWCTMQPVEVIELIHQLSANVGCHIALKPRDDFSSWREWRVSEAEKKHLNGWAPFVNDMAPFQQLGASGFDQAGAEAAIKRDLAQKEYEYVNGGARIKGTNNETVATKKPRNRRSAKSAPAAA